MELRAGDFVELRGRPWLVERPPAPDDPFATTGLSCIADDAQGESLDVLLDAEVEPSLLGRDEWQTIGVDGAEVLSAYLRVLSADPTAASLSATSGGFSEGKERSARSGLDSPMGRDT